MKTAKVVQTPGKEVPTEILATAISDVAAGIKALRSGRLNDRALVLLIQDAAPAKLSLADIRAVLNGMEALESTFCRARRTSK